MTTRIIAIAVVAVCLVGLIAYSQFRPQPNFVSGFIEADEIRLGSRVGGRVQAVYAEEGDRALPGQVLIQLEPFDLLERENEARQTLAARTAEYERLTAGLRPEEVAQAKARLDQLQARLDLLEAGPRKQEIEAARGRVRVAEAEVLLAKRIFERRAELFQKSAIAREEYDAASEDLSSAQATLDVRKNELELLEIGTREEEIREARAKVEEARQAWQLAEGGYRREEVEQAKASRDAAQAALEAIREQKKELVVTSPIHGVVESLDLRKGDLVPAGAPVLSVLDNSHMWVRAYVPENRVGLQTGQHIDVTVDSLGSQRFPGEITFIAREAEFTPSNVQTPEDRSKLVFRVKVTLTQHLDKLRPGMSADLWLDSAR
ncbi:MAG TPA: efflux RND transporter periplasmic adaptor subunit [Pirellulaceae bacterium]|nr:efflux RND transporter periplasmic adaptor subunit [Pirellulaceae bacterium]